MSQIVLSCLVFCLGLYGVLARRELIAVLAAVEVMLGGATLLLVSLSATYVPLSLAGEVGTGVEGQALALLLLAIVASEAAVGLALLVALVRRGRTRMDEIGEVSG